MVFLTNVMTCRVAIETCLVMWLSVSFSRHNYLHLLALLIFVDQGFGRLFCKLSAQPFPGFIGVRPRYYRDS